MLRISFFLAVLLLFASCGKKEGDSASIPPALLDPQSPQMNETAPDAFKAEFNTTKGRFVIQVHRDWAPIGADRFYNLVKQGFYNGTSFYRVMPNFIVQWGMSGYPKLAAIWSGNPELNPNASQIRLQDEPVQQSNKRGTVTYAKAGPNTRTTQVFINLKDNESLDNQDFPPFGEVTEGLEIVEQLYSEYGEQVRYSLGKVAEKGTAYLKEKFPELDYVETARIVE
jgi:peptidyl-prolyl cis-trans isomerase A (cyclophilin A)